ncbi:MAG: DUF2202 domain-containing protein [Gammaproteobacteria bacterium]|nr:DUF2202 domain-containing protein [Gammaproteobacteria bacterium]
MKPICKLTTAIIISFSLPALLTSNALAANQPKEQGRVVQETDDDTPLDKNEASHLTFMREEEKLARDIYLNFANMYPEQIVFAKIATESEQTHTDVMRDKLTQYNLPDPNPATNDLPDSLGVFTGEEWGWYFTEKYTALTALGSESELQSLYAGALIEELDMHDITDCPEVMVDAGYNDPCGLHYTDEVGLINSYRSLIDGSESHLRSYVGQIEAVIGVGNYEAQYLSQAEVDAILGR